MSLEDPPEPPNHGPLPPFHTLVKNVFRPLSTDLHALCLASRKGPHELRQEIISKFMKNWRAKVGPNLFPALRLSESASIIPLYFEANSVLPDQDKHRPMYNLKERALARLLIKVLNLSSESVDAKSLLQWKQGPVTSAGNFSDRCYDILSKRDTHSTYGTMTIAEVNQLLDELSQDTKDITQMEVMKKFVSAMNAEELRWLIRIILRYVHVGVSEKTIFQNFHPDANDLFNVTTDLRRVCYQLYDLNYSLPSQDHELRLMGCFQPQLAAFSKLSYENVVKIMPGTGFYIEEKMDGERIQIHLADSGRTLKFFSRKAKDYTYLYGSSFEDPEGSLSKHLRTVFNPRVRNCIIDGEMVAWDPEDETVVSFGSLKTAALNEQRGAGLTRPMFVAFDILYLNDKVLVDYPLRERRQALNRVVTSSPGYFEILKYVTAKTTLEIEKKLHEVIEQASEGLVIKNPSSPYRVSERVDTWIKVKPEYMEEFGENLDLCVIGGYFGSGHRSKNIATYLCGLRVDDPEAPMKFWSFCKVGGGFAAADFAEIRHATQGKWHRTENSPLPSHFVELEGRKEMPDLWINPIDSLVFEVKASQVVASTSFKAGLTLRFPRFRRIRKDKDWSTSLSLKEFNSLQYETTKAVEENNRLKIEKRRVKAPTRKRLKLLSESAVVLDDLKVESNIYLGVCFHVVGDIEHPKRMSKSDLELLIKRNGGTLTQSIKNSGSIKIADRKLVAVAAIIRNRSTDVIRPSWLFDCIEVGTMLPLEPQDFLFALPHTLELAKVNLDEYGDSYRRKVDGTSLGKIVESMTLTPDPTDEETIKEMALELRDIDPAPMKGFLFPMEKFYFDTVDAAAGAHTELLESTRQANCDFESVKPLVEFSGGEILGNLDHTVGMVVVSSRDLSRVGSLRSRISRFPQPIRIVKTDWIANSWVEGTRLAEEDYTV